MDSGVKASAVQKDVAEGRSLGVSGTPYFVIGNEKFSGALPFTDFQRIIEDALQ